MLNFFVIPFRNNWPTIFMLFHICKCRRLRKWRQNNAPEVRIPAE